MSSHELVFLADAMVDDEAAAKLAAQAGIQYYIFIERRNHALGWFAIEPVQEQQELASLQQAWAASQPLVLPAYLQQNLAAVQQQLNASMQWALELLDGEISPELLLDVEVFQRRWQAKFEYLGALYHDADVQEICSLQFRSLQRADVDDIWAKLAWLSLNEDDASFRLRCSHGEDHYQTVSSDNERQQISVDLFNCFFPESRIISEHDSLKALIAQLIESKQFDFVERIAYFNAPNGGAQFHQDVERGHEGVIYAQLSGHTAWIALSKEQLIEELCEYLTGLAQDSDVFQQHPQLAQLRDDKSLLDGLMDNLDHPQLEFILNHHAPFTCQLIARGYSRVLQPGDVILLPQQDLQHCAWHTVYGLGDDIGEALSFAIKKRS